MMNQDFDFLVDTGASVNIISYDQYKRLDGIKLENTSVNIFAFDGTKPLNIKGKFQTIIEYKGRKQLSTIYVSSASNSNSLLSYETSVQLNIVNVIHNVDLKSQVED